MAQPVSTPQQVPALLPPARKARAVIALTGAALGAAVVGSLLLWFHYGTAVFFEMIVSGINACL